MPPFAAIGVPIDSVGRSGGTELAPAAVRERGLLERVGARDRGDLDVRIRGDDRDPATGIVGAADVLAVTTAARAAVREAVTVGERPLVLGGCCGLVPGALAGLRDAAGPFGFGPKPWVEAAGGPSAQPDRVVVLGARDPEEAADIAPLLAGELAALAVHDPVGLRAAGLHASGKH